MIQEIQQQKDKMKTLEAELVSANQALDAETVGSKKYV